jgi:hypothetical protein
MDGDYCIAINPKEDNTADMLVPINEHTLEVVGKTTQDAIAEAIRGEKDHFFLDGKALVAILNVSMKKEVQYLEDLIENCKKMVTTLKGDIAQNEKKAQDVSDAWIKSAIPDNVVMPSGTEGTNVRITVNEKND